ncbi:MAG TPA: phosphate signaling complex protein PhoU [Burkholderiaceae bacterium]|jgi:phosphate transport system protein|nr:phosphate signaling complex protein PhoU [Burkholderiaceae bacterium]
MPTEHTYKAFDVDIDTLRSSVTTMGGLVERQFVRAVDAVRYGDLRRVMDVLSDEQTVNRMHIESDLRCNQVIARRQPIAVDLRETIAVIHSINDLERIGDEAKKIALKAQHFNGRELPVSLDKIQRMADLVAEMLGAAIDAFVRHDTAVSRRLAERDREVDGLRDALIEQLIAQMSAEPTQVSDLLALVFVVQSIERVGDHAKNIAEYVVHVVEGIDTRHGGDALPGQG